MVEAAGERAHIKQKLKTMADEHIGKWDQYADREFKNSDHGFDFTSRQVLLGEGIILTVSKATVPGLTLDDHKFFRDNIVAMLPKLDEKLSVSDLPDFKGYRALIQHIKMPMLMTNRSIPQVYDTQENEDGTFEFFSSSEETEELVEAQKKVVKKDVIANNIINYVKLTPVEGGCEWVSVQALDIAGSIPDMLKKQGASKQAQQAMFMIKIVKNRGQ